MILCDFVDYDDERMGVRVKVKKRELSRKK